MSEQGKGPGFEVKGPVPKGKGGRGFEIGLRFATDKVIGPHGLEIDPARDEKISSDPVWPKP
jgi:hypothetical protein